MPQSRREFLKSLGVGAAAATAFPATASAQHDPAAIQYTVERMLFMTFMRQHEEVIASKIDREISEGVGVIQKNDMNEEKASFQAAAKYYAPLNERLCLTHVVKILAHGKGISIGDVGVAHKQYDESPHTFLEENKKLKKQFRELIQEPGNKDKVPTHIIEMIERYSQAQGPSRPV